MSKIALSGNASGTGTFTIASPNSNSNYQLDLPAESGTIITTASTTGISASALTTGTIPKARMYAGAVLQVVQATTTTNTSTTSSSYVAVTNLTASITPSSTSNKVLIIVNMNVFGSTSSTEAAITLYRAGADLTAGAGFADTYTGSSDFIMQAPMTYLDSPSSTSSVTYAVYFKRTQGSGTVQTSLRGTTSTITLMEIAA